MLILYGDSDVFNSISKAISNSSYSICIVFPSFSFSFLFFISDIYINTSYYNAICLGSLKI